MLRDRQNDVIGTFSIKKKYKTFKLSLEADLKPGVTAIFGNSGSGKTSLLNCLSGLVSPDEGNVYLDGEELFNSNSNKNVKPENRKIGYVLQDSLIFPHLSVWDNINYGYKLVSHENRKINPKDLIQIMGLSELLDRRPTELSGGEARRVAIARALAISPKILMLDEPMQGLDFGVRGSIIRYLTRIKNELNIHMILVSHSISEVLVLAQHVILIDKGQKVAEGSVQEILSSQRVTDVIDISELENVFEAIVKDNGQDSGTGAILLNGLEIEVPVFNAKIGSKATASIRAADIIISNHLPKGLSARNVLKGIVKEVVDSTSRPVIYVDVGTMMIVEITSRSLAELGIELGSEVHLIIKANSIGVAEIN